MFKIHSNQIVHRLKIAAYIEYWFPLKKGPFWAFWGIKTWFPLCKWFQTWSNKVDSESPCCHFDTKNDVVTMKNISVRLFSNAMNPLWAPVGGQSLSIKDTCSKAINIIVCDSILRPGHLIAQISLCLYLKLPAWPGAGNFVEWLLDGIFLTGTL